MRSRGEDGVLEVDAAGVEPRGCCSRATRGVRGSRVGPVDVGDYQATGSGGLHETVTLQQLEIRDRYRIEKR